MLMQSVYWNIIIALNTTKIEIEIIKTRSIQNTFFDSIIEEINEMLTDDLTNYSYKFYVIDISSRISIQIQIGQIIIQ